MMIQVVSRGIFVGVVMIRFLCAVAHPQVKIAGINPIVIAKVAEINPIVHNSNYYNHTS
jgi:hypothetical protein